MTILLVLAVVGMTVLGAVASLMLKLTSGNESLTALARDWHFYAGAFGYVGAALVNIWVLRHLDLSVVLPLTSLTYVWTLVLAKALLHEVLTPRKVLAVGLIMMGVACIALG